MTFAYACITKHKTAICEKDMLTRYPTPQAQLCKAELVKLYPSRQAISLFDARAATSRRHTGNTITNLYWEQEIKKLEPVKKWDQKSGGEGECERKLEDGAGSSIFYRRRKGGGE